MHASDWGGTDQCINIRVIQDPAKISNCLGCLADGALDQVSTTGRSLAIDVTDILDLHVWLLSKAVCQ